jgi:hypothetical protein
MHVRYQKKSDEYVKISNSHLLIAIYAILAFSDAIGA